MNCPIIIHDSDAYQWQSSGWRHTQRIEITNNQWQSQLLVATEELAKTTARIAELQLAQSINLSNDTRNTIKELSKRAAIVRGDIRTMVLKGSTVNAKWDE